MNKKKEARSMQVNLGHLTIFTLMLGTVSSAAFAAPTPGYVPPVTLATTPNYADDTRGVFVPSHQEFRLKTQNELDGYSSVPARALQQQVAPTAAAMNHVSQGYGSAANELNRIANGGVASNPQPYMEGVQMAQGYGHNGAANLWGGAQAYGGNVAAQYPQPSMVAPAANPMMAQRQMPVMQPFAPNTGSTMVAQPVAPAYTTMPRLDNGVEIAVGDVASPQILDLNNSTVRLREERISVRRVIRRMMDQVGGSEWNVVWDMAEGNAGLPDMEISLYAEEPFMSVMNSLLARLQTRSGQPLRVIRYDNSKRLVITDQPQGPRKDVVSSVGVDDSNVVVTEAVLREALVSLHYDEIPLADALENIVAQAGRNQWRLRMYAGMDQVLKPAHVEEPFNIAMERLLQLFSLKYEIFPGGKLIVVTHRNTYGQNGGQH